MPRELMLMGILTNLLYFELTGLSAGGMITCGFLVLYLGQPQRILITVLQGITVYLVGRLVSRYWIIFGRRKWSIYILIGIAVNIASYRFSGILIGQEEAAGIGYLVPGLIGMDIDRQGLFRTMLSMMIVMGVLQIYLWLVI